MARISKMISRRIVRGSLRQLPANTLPEVLVSMALIGLMFALGSQLTLSMTGANSPPGQTQALLWAEAWLCEPIGPDGALLAERQQDGRRLTREIFILNPQTHLVKIEVKVYLGDEEVMSRWRYTFWEAEAKTDKP